MSDGAAASCDWRKPAKSAVEVRAGIVTSDPRAVPLEDAPRIGDAGRMTAENPGDTAQIRFEIAQAEDELRKVAELGLTDCPQRIAYAQASATLALARLLYYNTSFK